MSEDGLSEPLAGFQQISAFIEDLEIFISRFICPPEGSDTFIITQY